MTLSMYEVSIPVFTRAFGRLSHLLDKADAHAMAERIDSGVLVEARLIADMDPLRAQIQRASDTAKGCAMRLAGREVPSFPDTETTIADLRARIAKTVALLDTVTPAMLEGSEAREITLKMRQPVTFDGKSYLLTFALPNFFFHLTTAYAILRHTGVPIGKMDYLGPL